MTLLPPAGRPQAHEASAFTQVDVNDCISEFVESKATGPRIYSECKRARIFFWF